jgi:hypothetical protein
MPNGAIANYNMVNLPSLDPMSVGSRLGQFARIFCGEPETPLHNID